MYEQLLEKLNSNDVWTRALALHSIDADEIRDPVVLE